MTHKNETLELSFQVIDPVRAALALQVPGYDQQAMKAAALERFKATGKSVPGMLITTKERRLSANNANI